MWPRSYAKSFLVEFSETNYQKKQGFLERPLFPDSYFFTWDLNGTFYNLDDLRWHLLDSDCFSLIFEMTKFLFQLNVVSTWDSYLEHIYRLSLGVISIGCFLPNLSRVCYMPWANAKTCSQQCNQEVEYLHEPCAEQFSAYLFCSLRNIYQLWTLWASISFWWRRCFMFLLSIFQRAFG